MTMREDQIHLIIDSTCDIDDKLLEAYQVKIIPLIISINDVEYVDRQTLSSEDVYEAIKQDKRIKSSLPRAQDIIELFENYAMNNQRFIYITFSSKMSGSYNLARGILEDVQSRYPGVKMAVIDSKSGALATGLIVERALKVIESTDDFDAVCASIQHSVEHVHHIFMVNDLTQLQKGGRIGLVTAKLGNALKIRPIITVVDGSMKFLTQAHGTLKALKTVVSLTLEQQGAQSEKIGICYADDRQLAEQVKSLLQDEIPSVPIEIQTIGSILASHIGLEAVGVFFFDEGLTS